MSPDSNSNTNKHYRHSIRLKGFDYSQPGYYCVTICVKNLDCTYGFGTVTEGKMCLNHRGEIAQAVWNSLPQRFPGTVLDSFVFMPNHMHGILIRESQTFPSQHRKPTPPFQIGSPYDRLMITRRDVKGQPLILGEIVRTFKAATTRLIRVNDTPQFAWQHNYYEKIVSNQRHLDALRAYIINNPARWGDDSLHR